MRMLLSLLLLLSVITIMPGAAARDHEPQSPRSAVGVDRR